jgi:hypothetical protein
MWNAGPQDIMVNLDVVSLFTRLPVRDAMSLLRRHFQDITGLFRHALTASYFSFAGQFNE